MATGTGNLPYPGKSYTPFDILTAEELNEDVDNIESLADGTGIGDAAVTADKIDFTTLKVFMPDYANKEATNRITVSDGTWTVTTRGFVYLYSNGFVNGAPYDRDIFFINNAVVGHVYVEATQGTGNARVGSSSAVLPVKAGDVVKVYGNNATQCYFIPGVWV